MCKVLWKVEERLATYEMGVGGGSVTEEVTFAVDPKE